MGYGEAPRLKISHTVTPKDHTSLFDVKRRSRIASTAAQRHAISRLTANAVVCEMQLWCMTHLLMRESYDE
jgi:hypothetical protein